MSKKFFIGLAVAATVALTSACASPGEPTISTSPTPTASPTPTYTAMTPAEAKASYKKIAEASCDTALEYGVVEISEAAKVVMTPKVKGYKDFNAAYFASPDTYDIIWEIDGIYSCADSFTFSMSEEAGVPAAIDVTFDEATGKYTTTQIFDQDTYVYTATITNGRLSSVYSSVTKNETSLKYGNQTAEDQKVLTTAVDRYLASIGQ